MQCPECETTMHMDSSGVCSCISCGYRHDQKTPKEYSTCGATYSNIGLMQGVEPKFMAEAVKEMPKIAGTKFTNDAGEKLQSTEETLKERGNRYGEFKNHANLSQSMKNLFSEHVRIHGQPENFTHEMSEAIEMIFHKLARIANGDPTYIDNFVDIAGYAQLVVDELGKK